MTTVYVAIVNDRHVDPDPWVFSTAARAVDFARTWFQDHVHPDVVDDEDVGEQEMDGWLYYASYSVEGDAVWVVEKVVDGETA